MQLANDDVAVVRAALRGDSAAFDILMDRHYPSLLRVCLQLVGERTLAEDCAQDASIIATVRMGDGTRDEAQDLAPGLINAQNSRRSAKALSFEVAQEAMHSRRPGPCPPAHRGADALHRASHVSAVKDLSRG